MSPLFFFQPAFFWRLDKYENLSYLFCLAVNIFLDLKINICYRFSKRFDCWLRR